MISFLNRFNKKKQASYFLVLILKNEKVNAVVFEEIEAKVKVIGQHEEYFQESIEKTSPEDFAEILDKAISRAEEALPENIETQKTIFGVKEDWTEKNKIKKEYLLRLKDASNKLGLIPIGFLVIPEAIAHFMQKEEGAPVSAIFVDYGKKFITVSLIKTGRLTETKTSSIHESAAFTVDVLLKHLETAEILPSRIVIYDGNEDLNQEFVSHQWSKSLPFLHLPQIMSLSAGFDARAILFGAASQMGFEVLEGREEKGLEKPKKEEAQKEIPPIEGEEMLEETTSQDFGFEKEKDVAKTHVEKLGIAPIHRPLNDTPTQVNQKVSQSAMPKFGKPTAIIKNAFGNIFVVFKKIINSKKSLPRPTVSANFLSKKLIFIPLIGIIIFLAIFIFSNYFAHTTITININPRAVEQNGNVIFTTSNAKTDSLDGIISGELVSISEEGQSSTSTTGKKEIGEKARGTVTIFNSLSQNKTLASGTILKAQNGLEFTLDQGITINRVATHSADEPTSPTTTAAQVSASQIGKEGNLPAGTKFIVGSFDIADLVAKNDNPFSGGTKKEVIVVSKNDTDKLLSELPKALEQKAKDNLIKNLSSDKNLLPAFTQIFLVQKEFDKNIGDQSSTITLKGTVSYEGLSYNQGDLTKIAKNLLESKIPSDLTINYNDIKVEVKDITKKNNNDINANLNMKGRLIPKIDEKKLAQALMGMSYQKAKDKLLKVSLVSSVKISSSLTLPFLETVSKTPGNIRILLNIND